MNKKVMTFAALTLSMSLITGCDKAAEESKNLNNPDPAHEGMNMADEAELEAVKKIDEAKKNVSEQLNNAKETLNEAKDDATQTLNDAKDEAAQKLGNMKDSATEKLNDAKEALNSPDPAHDGMELADDAEKKMNADFEKAGQEFDAEMKKIEE